MTSQFLWLILVICNMKRWRGKHFNTSFCFSSCPACVPNCRSRLRWTQLSSWKHWLATSWTWSSITKTTEHLRWKVTNITVCLWRQEGGEERDSLCGADTGQQLTWCLLVQWQVVMKRVVDSKNSSGRIINLQCLKGRGPGVQRGSRIALAI